MRLWTTLPLLAVTVTGVWAQQQNQDSPMRDAATHEQLAAKLRTVGGQDPMSEFEPSKGPDPSKAERGPDLLSQSDFLCFGGRATLVPKRAVLHTPEKLAERMKLAPGARIQSWTEFFGENRGWITTVEVTRAQAEGNQPMDEETRKRYLDGGKLVVATFHGGPISVLPPKTPVPTPDSTQPDKAPSDKAPSDKAPSDKAPSDKAPSDKAPSDKAPSAQTQPLNP